MLAGFPVLDPVGPSHVGLASATEIAATVVAPRAAEADRAGVDRATLDLLAAAGLLGAPLDPPAAQRELGELLAGSDASTWFCWVQHQTPLRVLAAASPDDDAPMAAELKAELLPGLESGRILAAVAFAHLRRPGTPNPSATRVPGGWRIDGTLDWVTSWDIADVVLVLAQGTGADAGRIVAAYLPAGRGPAWPGVAPGPCLSLLAMSGTHTRPVSLTSVLVPHERVAAVLDREVWLRDDTARSAGASPAAFGVTRGAVAELAVIADRRADPAIAGLAAELAAETRRVRSAAYAAADEVPADADVIDRRLALRARALDLAGRATAAAVVAGAGAAMRRGSPAERRAREALFLQVQAQTAASRAASVALLRRRGDGSSGGS